MDQTDQTIARPLPPPSALSKPYWEGAAAGRLLIQRCTNCGKLRHYPRLLCDSCHSTAVAWIQANGRGAIHSWTVAHHAYHPSFASELPYTLVTVDLEEGVRALGRWRGETPAIGQKVWGRFEVRADSIDLVFTPCSA